MAISLIYLSAQGSRGSGSWIGNYKGHGYMLTAAHMFDEKSKASDQTVGLNKMLILCAIL